MYLNAKEVLPPRLLREVQRFVQGKEIYIPKESQEHLGWGERNGTRVELERRNQEIRAAFLRGVSIFALMERYHLSHDSIRKIVGKVSSEENLTGRR